MFHGYPNDFLLLVEIFGHGGMDAASIVAPQP